MGHDSLSINVLELFGMVWTSCVMIAIRQDLPSRDGEAMLMRGDNSSAVEWVLNCKWGIDDVRAEGQIRIPGALEVKGK